MKKLAIVINGKGGVGKDTLCDFAAKHYKTLNVSSITPIKEIAATHGWNGEKTPKARKFLADLKQIFTEWNDLPNSYSLEKYEEFLNGDYQLFFVHIREGKEIEKFVSGAEKLGKKPITMLITSKRCERKYGNASDDDVESFSYDYTYRNDLPLEKAEDDFMRFLNGIMGG